MFFIMGLSNKHEKLNFNQNIICDNCGKYGRYEVIMEYMYFSLFFIPLIKWNKKFFVLSTCCDSVYSISKELGNRIKRGEDVTLTENDLAEIKLSDFDKTNNCPNCGYEANVEFKFCPNCGKEIKKD